jgi:hypothetical protein
VSAAVARRNDNTLETEAPQPTREEVLARYRHLRSISRRHNDNAMNFLPKGAILHNARRLGLADGKTFVLDNMDELTLAFDLAIYTAPADRSRAIDRYAGSAKLEPGSDEANVLEAQRNALFAIVQVERRHEAAGLIVTDLLRNIELWLVDEGLETSLPDGTMFATRYYTPDRFSMTAGIVLPVDPDLLERAIGSKSYLERKSIEEALGDRRFAEAIYRAGIAAGIAGNIRYEDPQDIVEP